MRLQIPRIPRDHWDSQIPDYDLLTLESCKLLFEESRQYLNEVIQESEELSQRSWRMLLWLLPAIAAIVGFVLGNKEKFKSIDEFNFLLILGCTACLINCILRLSMLFSPRNIHYRGAKPEEMMRQEIFSFNDPITVEKALFVSELERIQIKIEQVEWWNYQRMLNYSSVIQSFGIMIIMGIILLVRAI